MVLAFIFVLLALNPLPIQGGDWPQWLGPNRNGVIPGEELDSSWPKEGPPVLWKKSVGIGFSPLSIKGKKGYTLGHKKGEDTVFCLQIDTGEEVWSHSYPCHLHDLQHLGGPAGAPLIDNGSVFTLSRDGEVFCFDADTGEVKWTRNPHRELETQLPLFGFVASPLLANGEQVVFDVGSVVAFNMQNGEMIWNSQDYGATYSSPVLFELHGKDYIAVFNTAGLILLDASTGAEVWMKEWKTPNYDTNTATPVVLGDQVFISSGYDRGCALISLGKEPGSDIVWQNERMRSYHNTFIFWDEHLYGFDHEPGQEVLKCIQFSTGEEKWKKNLGGMGCLVVVDKKLLIFSDKGEVIIAEASPEEYREVTRSHLMGGTCWTIPVLVEEKLFLRNGKGELACFDVSAGAEGAVSKSE